MKLLIYSRKIYPEDTLNRFHILKAHTFLFCFHCGAISTFAQNTKVAIFPDKHVSILVESFMIGYTTFRLKLETFNFIF